MHTSSLKGGAPWEVREVEVGATAWTVAHLHIWHANDIQRIGERYDTIYGVGCAVHGARYTIFIFAFRFIRCSDAFNCSSCIKICNFILSPRLVTRTRDPLGPRHDWGTEVALLCGCNKQLFGKKERENKKHKKHANCANIIENFTLTRRTEFNYYRDWKLVNILAITK